jgi:hypothetical protein
MGGVEGPDEDNKISVMEFICSLKTKRIFIRRGIGGIYCWLLTSIR